MLIRSQNGRILAPLEIGFLMAMENDDNKFLIIQGPLALEHPHSGIILGKYESRETALKVMADIQQAYKESKRVYMMPMEEEE